eukprot:g8675.t1
MDVIEAEDMGMPGGKKDAKAVANNRRIRECQKPILLNWALVILDIDSSCVKALFRRGQCQIQLGSLEDAKKDDLQKARDLDASIADDVEKELVKLKRQQKALDQQDRGWAQKALKKGLADERHGMAGNAACWRGGFSFTTCCAAGGNPECFDSIYTYEVCCLDTKNVNALPQDCRTNEDVASSPRKAQCRGTFGVTKDDWDHFFLAHQLSQALGTSYKGWPDLMALWQKVNVSSASLEAAEEDCAFGVVALLLQSLPSSAAALKSCMAL